MFICFGSPVYLSSDVYPQNELLVPKLKGVVYKKHPKSKQTKKSKKTQQNKQRKNPRADLHRRDEA